LTRSTATPSRLFTTREAAEEFVAGDQFVLNGMVARWTIPPWTGLIQG